MADKLGITVEFKGETTEFNKAVKSVNNELKNTKSEISTVNKQLKLDPSSVENLQKKIDLLNNKSQQLTDKVKLYQDALNKMPTDKIGTDEWLKLNQELNKAQVELSQVNKELANMPTAKIQSLAQTLGDAEEKLNKIGGKIEDVGKKFYALTGAITGLATVGVTYNAELEKQTALFTTLTGSAEEAEKTLRAIKEDSLGSPFDTQSLISANQYLIATGIEADKSRETIMALGNAISATGGGNSELQRMAQNLQQVKNVGKATTMDIRQFAMAGIDIYGILAESTGKTAAEIQEMDITFDMLNDALIKASEEGGKYYGAMEAQADTLNGKISMLKATFQELMGSLTESLMPILKQILDYAQNLITKFSGLSEEQKKAVVRIAAILASIAPLLTIIGKVTKGIGSLSGAIKKIITGEKFVGWLSAVSQAGGGLNGVLSTLIQTLGKIINPVTAVVAVFVALYMKSEDFRNAVNKLIQTLLTALKPALELIKSVINLLITVIKNVGSVILNVFKKALDTLGTALSPVINLVSSLVGWLADKLKPAFDLVKAVVELVTAKFKLLATNLNGTVSKAFNSIKGVIDSVKNTINTLIEKIKNLYDWFANTTFGQKFINMFEKIGGVVNKVKDWVGGLISDLNDSIDRTNQLVAVQDNASRYANSTKTSRAVTQLDSGGLGLASGGIGLTTNIHVYNNGTPIDTQTIQSWVDEMADKIDSVLGRRF